MAKQVIYKDYIFPENITMVEVKYSKDISFDRLPFSEEVKSSVKGGKMIISGEGVIPLDGDSEKLDELLELYNEETKGELSITGMPTITAYFSSFSAVSLPGPNVVRFKFQFAEEV